ncbi:hypothetical protein, partial [Lactococcus cremoris]|uniref:hypothetical protein n=1 Tax=Lactococcus lactis subsp. cremoris TaxID=1359 RepID=UPI0021822AC1
MKIVENIKCPENDHFLNTKISKNIGLRRWKVNEKLDTELREFKNYIFQSLLETCNQDLNA